MSDLPPREEDADELAHAIAIIGMAGRFPGARDLDQYWDNLIRGVESISTFSDEEILASGVDPELLRDPNYVKARAVLADVDQFDAAFFGINPREADAMDPQQRLFLECAWQALENAGYDPLSVPGAVGVWGGCAPNSYARNNVACNREFTASVGAFTTAIVNYASFLTTRVSYKLNLTGPSIEVSTACSTSLVAVAQACHGLLTYQCDMALAGGVSVGVPQKVGYVHQQGEIFSADGHCRPFDAKATGTVGGEGVGLVVLKRFYDALTDGDHVRAVILGTALNNDGSDKIGFTAPSVAGQAEVITAALEVAGIEPDSVGYVEAHGTATPLGDPIEIAALSKAFRAGTDKKGYCGIGSVKSNIAHTDSAAGIASLIKAVGILEHEQIPPSLHFVQPNPEIDFTSSPFYVVAKPTPWPRGGQPRRAGVSSFGLGGTNAHAILQEAPVAAASEPGRSQHLVVLSGRTESALDAATARLAEHLRAHPDTNLADAAYTTQVGRHAFEQRRAVVCSDLPGALSALEGGDPRRVFSGSRQAEDPPVAFLFPGQGAQYVDMGRDLYASETTFRAQVDTCAELLTPHLGVDLRRHLYPEAATDEDRKALAQTRLTQPAIFTIEYALAQLWMSWGIEPDAMIGHSNGEYVAACLAGVFSLEDALALVALRGQMMQDLPPGDMLSVRLSEDEIRPMLGDQLSLAAVNAPALCVVSGPADAVGALAQLLEAKDLPATLLHTSHAFHSAMMDEIVEPFAARVAQVARSPATVRCVSTVTGDWIAPEDWTEPEYWARNLRQPVRFAAAALQLLAEPQRVLLEVGPGHTLTQLVRKHGQEATGRTVLPSMRHPQQQESDLTALLGTVGRLWLGGVHVDWSRFQHAARRQRIPLPGYPFERKRFWVEPQTGGAAVAAAPRQLGKSADIADWFYVPSWRRSVAPAAASNREAASWLVFCDDAGLGAKLAEHLGRDGPVVRVGAAAQRRKADDRRYEIRPGSREDYDWLLGELRAQRHVPQRIVHLWNVVSPEPARHGLTPGDLDTVDAAQTRGFYSLLFLAQALGEQFASEPIRIDVVSNGLFEVTGGDAVRADRATSLGPCRVIPAEYDNIACRVVDLPVAEPWLDLLTAELRAEGDDSAVAYRGLHRWLPTFEPARRPATTDTAPWRKQGRGAYLITGGLGGLGLALGEHIARAGTKLVLVGRSGLPDRAEWPRWIERHGEDDRTSRRIGSVRRLEERGATVLLETADVADLAQMTAAIRNARARFGAISGVIHAAGLATGGMIATRSAEDAAEVLDPKVRGTVILQSLLRNDDLDFFVLCSSVTSILAGLGGVDYCAANAFLDAVAHSRDFGGKTRFLAVNWDAWAEVGMAVETELRADLREARDKDLLQGIRTAEGTEAFDRMLAHPLPQIIVSTRDFLARTGADARSTPETLPPPAEPEQQQTSSLHERPELPQEYAAPDAGDQSTIAAVVQELLGIEKVGIHDNFFDLGFDSLLAHRLIGRLRERLAINLPLRFVFDLPTVAQLAEFIDGARAAAADSKKPS